ncbi:MAG: DNRLRE domain-containing protein [Candidatus Thiodiazotropha sp. (ex Lucinoma borealis)]|nr:DNRLRE domain-containing protein [Candidatus Thiodiazotropha sp. (ex Lucinoma borealis)]
MIRAAVRFDVVNPSSGSYDLYTVNSLWTEADAEWSDAIVLGIRIGSFSPVAIGSHLVTLDSTGIQAVQEWVDGGVNNGLVLISTGTSDGVDITSREGGNSAILEIRYEQTTTLIPLAPSGLLATTAGSDSINLSWSDNADNETQYVIERSLDAAAWTSAATLNANTSGYTDPNLNAATTYYYRVKADNGAGSSAYSNVSQATTDDAPEVIPAIPTNLRAEADSDVCIDIAWIDNADNETGFEIQRAIGSGAWSNVAILAADVVSYSDCGLTPSTRYDYRVAAINSAGLSGWSGIAYATTEGSQSQQQTLNLRNGVNNYIGTQDGYIASLKPDRKYNGKNIVTDGWHKKKGTEYSLLQWDLSEIPFDARIDSVSITLQITNATQGVYGLYAMTGVWSEGSALTWNSINGDSLRDTSLLGVLAPTAKGSYTLGLNQDGINWVQGWVNGSLANHGFMIVDHGSNDAVVFRSSNYATVTDRPMMSVTYKLGDFNPSLPNL